MQGNYTPDVGNTLAATALQSWQKTAADGAAGTATAETVVGVQGSATGFAVGKVVFAAAAALTSNDTNYATITVAKRTAGGSPTTLASVTTQTTGGGGSGNWTAWTAVSIPVSAGATIAPGDVITVAITKTGTGVVVPQGQLEVFAVLT